MSDMFGLEPAKADRMLAAMGKAFRMVQVNGYANHEPKFAGCFDAKHVRVGWSGAKVEPGDVRRVRPLSW